MSKLELKNISKKFPGEKNTEIFHNANFIFEPNKTYAITGVSGIGKSTLLHMLAGLESSSSGDILFDNKNIFQFSKKEKENYLSQNLGLVFQEPNLIQELNVFENIILKGLISGKSFDVCEKLADELLKKLNLQDKKYDLPMTLSGGQQQRVSVLRAIFNKPNFILADEPTGNLDKSNAQDIVELLLNLNRDFKIGVILTTHDFNVANQMDYVLKLEDLSLKVLS